ncbi:glycosyltransferase family 10, partial [Flavobacteriaceae bacterium]|nr:glycosyltransferase family 10 [Flavobacteriaceae bacterium]
FCDFAVSFDYNNNKNHFRLPLYSVYFTNQNLTKRRDAKALLHKKIGFCSFVVSNAKESEERINFFHELSKYKEIASGGKHANNVGGPVSNKRDFISKYLFNIAFENSSFPGYTTEKIAEAWLEGCIPIYWGDPEITRDINPGCFINVHDFDCFDAAIAYIKEVDASPELQIKYLSAPLFRNNEVPEYLKDEVISKKLKRFIDKCLDGFPNKAAKFWHKPYYYVRKIRGGSRLIKINLR